MYVELILQIPAFSAWLILSALIQLSRFVTQMVYVNNAQVTSIALLYSLQWGNRLALACPMVVLNVQQTPTAWIQKNLIAEPQLMRNAFSVLSHLIATTLYCLNATVLERAVLAQTTQIVLFIMDLKASLIVA